MEVKIMKKSKLTFWNIWSSYAVYYFGRVNLGIIIPALLATFNDLSMYNVGLISTMFALAYAFGQFIHGQMSERHNPYLYIAGGLILSGIMNAFLGFCGGFFVLLVVGETIDGFVQAMGWSSCVRANALTQENKNISRASTILGTSYQFGNSLAWLVSAFAVGQWGWEAGFFVSAIILTLRGILLWFTKPEITIPKKQPTMVTAKKSFSSPVLLASLGLCFLNMVRYGVMTWIPLYLFQQSNMTVEQMGKVGLKVFLFPIAGILGTLVYNRVKRISKDTLSVIYLVILAICFSAMPFTTGFSSVLLLAVSGFFLYGPHVFLVSTLPTRFKDKQIVSASTGIINCGGYLGTAAIGLIVPFLVINTNGWNSVFLFWSVISALTAVIVGVNYVKSFKK
jgi:OPA family glycerol-3-phosphate transporter-like MFS transporter